MASRTAALRGLAVFALATACSSSGGQGTTEPPAPAFGTGQRSRQAPPAYVVGGFAAELPPVTLAPGEERSPCFIFPLEVTGPSRIVGGAKLTVGKGMHHGNVVTRKKTGEGIRPCPKEDNPEIIGGEGFDVINGGSVLFGSSTQVSGVEWRTFTDGEGFRVKDGYEIVARMHYLNPSSEPLTLAPKYEWFTIDESKLVHELAPFLWLYRDFTIPPLTTKTLSATCSFPAGMHIVSAMPHMHARGVAFTAGFAGGKLDGKLFLESKGYDPEQGVIAQYDPPIDLSQGDGATFSCTWKNELGKELHEGIGDNEMCILMGYAWPPESTFAAAISEGGGCVYIHP